MKAQEKLIKGFMNAGFEIARSDSGVYMVKQGCMALRLVYNKKGLVCIMRGGCEIWRA